MNTNITVDRFRLGQTPRKIVAALRQAKNRGRTVNELTERTGAEFSTTRRRVSEMLEDGILVHGSERKCRVTGRTVSTYKLRESMSGLVI